MFYNIVMNMVLFIVEYDVMFFLLVYFRLVWIVYGVLVGNLFIKEDEGWFFLRIDF